VRPVRRSSAITKVAKGGFYPSANWKSAWSARTGTTDLKTLLRTRLAVNDMDSSKLRSTNLSILGDSRMRRSTHTGHFPEATFPGEVTHLDVFASGKDNQPVGLSGERTSVRLAVLFVDGYSHFKAVYFCNSEKQVPSLTAFYLAELGRAHFCGGHFVLEDGATRHIHTDGGKSMNSEEFSKVLRAFGLSANVTSCPHTPSSNGMAERSFATLTPDVRAALRVAGLPHKYWDWALRHRVHARNKLATRPVVNATTGLTEYKTPFELYWRRKPSLKHACSFGAPCRILLLGEQRPRGKFSTHTLRGHVLGRGEDGVQLNKEYRYLLGWLVLTEQGRILQSRHVQMDERYAVRPTFEGGNEPTPYPWQGPLPDDTAAEMDLAAGVTGVKDGPLPDYTAAELNSAADVADAAESCRRAERRAAASAARVDRAATRVDRASCTVAVSREPAQRQGAATL
jgi:hypothetical protein